jgi:glycosyltransferase involved in cell wall biosynthesis
MNPVPVSLLPPVYAAANVVVNFPSKDAFPVTFLEAAACEKPVISCLLPAYEGTFAVKYFKMVKKDSISDISDAMVNHVNSGATSPGSRLEEARRLIVSEYDQTRTSAQLMAHYKGVLANK